MRQKINLIEKGECLYMRLITAKGLHAVIYSVSDVSTARQPFRKTLYEIYFFPF